MTRIAICGETYSPNLGDGVIADSLKWLIQQVQPDTEVVLVDICAGLGLASETHAQRSRLREAHRLLASIPLYSRMSILPLWYIHKRKSLSRVWRRQLQGCDLVVIGGGQLLLDNHLVFPLKIREFTDIARDMHERVAFYACGVGKEWSRFGFRLLKQALLGERTAWISVRDNASRETLRALLPGANFECGLSIDPAVCAAEVYGATAEARSDLIGLGIAAPKALSWRAEHGKQVFSTAHLTRFWLDLARHLLRDGQRFAFFTNGDPGDHAFAREIVQELSDLGEGRVTLLDRPREPRTLVAQVARCRAVVAHRLHANIIAYSLGIPSVGLVWNQKVEEFGRLTERSRFFVDPVDLQASAVGLLAGEAIDAGVNSSRLSELKASALEDVRCMLRKASCERRGIEETSTP